MKTLKQCQEKMNLKSISDVVRSLIANARDNKISLEEINNKIIRNYNTTRTTLELLKQFYGEMSYKDYDPSARQSDRVRHFLNDLYNQDDKFMK